MTCTLIVQRDSACGQPPARIEGGSAVPGAPASTLSRLLPRLPLEGADIDDADAVAVAVAGPGDPALVGEGGEVVVAPVDGGAARQQRVGLGRAAVEGQRAEHRVERVAGGAHLVAGGAEAAREAVHD